jgi:hypothetical protein
MLIIKGKIKTDSNNLGQLFTGVVLKSNLKNNKKTKTKSKKRNQNRNSPKTRECIGNKKPTKNSSKEGTKLLFNIILKQYS